MGGLVCLCPTISNNLSMLYVGKRPYNLRRKYEKYNQTHLIIQRKKSKPNSPNVNNYEYKYKSDIKMKFKCFCCKKSNHAIKYCSLKLPKIKQLQFNPT
jgi:hypothetical protein